MAVQYHGALKKQPVVALSTTEAEYIASTHAMKEVLWTQTFLAELIRLLLQPMTLFGDNQSAIVLANDDQFHVRTKHINIHYHFMNHP